MYGSIINEKNICDIFEDYCKYEFDCNNCQLLNEYNDCTIEFQECLDKENKENKEDDMKKAKGFISFEEVKEIFNLPKDALLKQFLVNPITDEIEIVYYTREGEYVMDEIKRHKLVPTALPSYIVNFDELADIIDKRTQTTNIFAPDIDTDIDIPTLLKFWDKCNSRHKEFGGMA